MPRAPFRRLIVRLSIAGIIILIAFPLGMLAYLHTLKGPNTIAVKNLKSVIQEASAHDITIIAGAKSFLIPQSTLAGWTEPYTRFYSGKEYVRFTRAFDDFVAMIAAKSDREPSDARFTINDSGSATILIPSRKGQLLNIERAKSQLYEGILSSGATITLEIQATDPAITEDKIKALGINDRLAVGESNFSGSTPARIQNIKISSKLFNGLIIKPGERFSFDAILGDVTASTGYVPEKVIKENKIEYEYGGGIFQLSTTLFQPAI